MLPVFKIDRNNKCVIHPQAAKLEPCLRKITEKELYCIILAVDLGESPYKALTKEERWRRAKFEAFGSEKHDTTNNKKFNEAVNAYEGLVFNHKLVMRDGLLSKIMSLNVALMDATDPKKINDIRLSLGFISKEIDSIEKEIKLDLVIEGNGNISGMSYIEQWQENMRNKKSYDIKAPVVQVEW